MTATIYDANSGGPMSRTRKEPIRSTILGKAVGPIRFDRVQTVGLEFSAIPSRVGFVTRLLAHAGFTNAEELRAVFSFPTNCLIARPAHESFQPVQAQSASWQAVLEQAFLLGLCTANLFDPDRPVLWTEASLARRLELYSPDGFYS